jgi:RNA recognition motif-containing protein
VFGLSLYTQERDLREAFSRYGPLEEVNVVYDHQTGRSRGFAFLYYRNLEDAVEVRISIKKRLLSKKKFLSRFIFSTIKQLLFQLFCSAKDPKK